MATHEYSHGATILKAENISVTLGGNPILRDVNLEIKDLRRPGAVVAARSSACSDPPEWARRPCSASSPGSTSRRRGAC